MPKQKLTKVPYALGAIVMMRKLRTVAIAQLVVAGIQVLALITLIAVVVATRTP